MSVYYRPLIRTGPKPAGHAPRLAGGWCWFDTVERLERGQDPHLQPASALPEDWRVALTTPRAPIAGLTLDVPRVMGILNVTPDSFSDGGLFQGEDMAVAHAAEMVAGGSDLLDIGGESTRPGAAFVPHQNEIARTAPVISRVAGAGYGPISIDTRKAGVARAAVGAGAGLINDVSGLMFDPEMARTAVALDVPICIMHAQGTPETMQAAPRYDNVLLDVYDALARQVALAEAAGMKRDRILLDPGIGFGKSVVHNLDLLRGISLFHGLGCGLLVGVSRKSLIGAVAGTRDPQDRLPGSLALGLALVDQGVHMLRVHDVAETRQALDLHLAVKAPDLLSKEI